MSIYNSLFKAKTDSGAQHNKKGMSFQYHYSLSKLLEVHQIDNDYTFFFDHIDDLIILEKIGNQEKINFFQIKKKGTRWTVQNIITEDIIKKMVNNYIQIGSDCNKIENLYFVTNSGFNFKLGNNYNRWVNYFELKSEQKKAILENIKNNFEEYQYRNIQNLFIFHECDIEPKNLRDCLIGKLNTFFKKIAPNIKINQVEPFYEAIIKEIEIKSDEFADQKNIEEFKKRKSLTRANFNEHLKYHLSGPNDYSKLELAEDSIQNPIVPWNLKKNFNKYRFNYALDSQGRDRTFDRIVQAISTLSKEFPREIVDGTILERWKYLRDKYFQSEHNDSIFDISYIEVIIFIEIHE